MADDVWAGVARQFLDEAYSSVKGYVRTYVMHQHLLEQLCRCAADGGVVSIMTGNARATAVQPALERRWEDALASFDARTGTGALGLRGRADTVEELAEAVAAVELEASRRDPYRQLSRVFHLIGRKGPN